MQTKIGQKKLQDAKVLIRIKQGKKIYTDHDVKKKCYKEKFRLGSGPL